MKVLDIRRREWFSLVIVVCVIVIGITVLKPVFLTKYNLQVLMATVAINTLIALSQAVIIALGQMNLSVGAIGGLAAVVFAGCMEILGFPVPLAIVAGLTVGIICGLANGYVVAKTGISAFIITLASLYIFTGITMGITKAIPFYGIPDSVKHFGDALLVGPIPMLVIPAVILAIVLGYIFARVKIGIHILAVGGNAHAAELGGVSLSRATIWAHLLSGLLAAVAGLMVVARIQIGQPTIGSDWLIISFAAPVIGGALLQGGQFNVVGTVLGVVIIALITQGLVLFGVDPFAVQIALGVLILWAVAIGPLRDWWARRSARAQIGKAVAGG